MIVDRVTALACLVILAWLAVAIAPDEVPDSLVAVLGIATASGVVGASLLGLAAKRGREGGTLLRRLNRPLAEVWAAIGGRAEARPVLVRTTLLGLLYQGTMVFASWILARSVNLDLSFALLAVVTPPSSSSLSFQSRSQASVSVKAVTSRC